MNLGQMRLELYDLFGFSANPEAEVVRRFDRFINNVYREMMAEKGVGRLRRWVMPFSSVANDPFAVMPVVCSKIITIVDRTNQQLMAPVDIQDIVWDDPGQTSLVAVPNMYAIINLSAALAIDPSDPSELFVKSTDVDDAAGMTAYVQAILQGGYPKPLQVALNGTTAASLDAVTTTVTGAMKFFLSSRAEGDVTLHEDSGAGTELARIPAGRTFSRYSKIQLHPTPTAVVEYHANIEVAIEDLESEMDEPLVLEDFHWVITAGAAVREWLRKGDATQAAIENQRYISGKREHKLRIANLSGVPGQMGPRRWSQLGAYFAPGT